MQKESLVNSPLFTSILLHAFVLVVLIILFVNPRLSSKKNIEFEVLEFPKLVNSTNLNMQIKEPQPTKAVPPAEKPRAVFGVSRQAITEQSPDAGTAQIKLGNTVAKENDQLELQKSDVDQLPIPTDDFLVTSMPRLKAEIRIPYPEQAKKAGVEGPVILDLLIDASGRVRKVDLVKGPGFGLNEAALAVAEKFEFTPARVSEKSVAVKIRYTYRFVLENR